jgi:hypothetical protein
VRTVGLADPFQILRRKKCGHARVRELRAVEEGAVGTSLPAAASFTCSPRLIQRRTCRPITGKVNRLWNDHAVGRVGLDGHGWRMWRLLVLFRVVEDAVVVGNVASPAPDARSYRVDGRTKFFLLLAARVAGAAYCTRPAPVPSTGFDPVSISRRLLLLLLLHRPRAHVVDRKARGHVRSLVLPDCWSLGFWSGRRPRRRFGMARRAAEGAVGRGSVMVETKVLKIPSSCIRH